MTDNELLTLIDRYFDAETTLEEERMLRRELATTLSTDPRVAEAGAVLAYVSEAGPRQAIIHHSYRRWRVAASAVATVVLALGIWFSADTLSSGSDCSSYIACNRCSDPDVAIALMNAQLNDISEASDVVTDAVLSDLSAITEAFNEFEY